jgi:outer membrane receptor protein involved in Fe transport
MPASIPYPSTGEARVADPVQLSVDPLSGKDYQGSDTEAFVASLVGEIEFGSLTLSSWTGYTDANLLSRADADFYAAVPTTVTIPGPAGTAEPLRALQITDIYSEVQQFSQELRLGNLDTDSRLRWALGGLYWTEDYDSVNQSIFISGFFRSPPLGPAAGWSAARELQIRGQIPGDLNYRNTDHWSVYGIAEFDFNDQWSIAAEARYSEEDFEYLFGRAITLSITPAGVIIPWPGYTGTPFRPESSSDFFTPKVTLNWKPNEDSLVYASAGKGEKPAGFLNVAVVLDPNDAFYKPEVLWNYEIGYKSSWMNNRLRFNAAYFHMIYEDRINQLLVPDARSPQGTSTLVVNQGEAKVDGVELELTAALTDGLTLSAAYTYLDPRFTDSEVPNTSALGVAGSGNCRVGTVGLIQVCYTNTNGNQLEQSSEHAIVAALDYRRTMTNGWDLTGSVGAQYRSKRYLSPDNLIWLPDVTLVDLQLGVENERYSALLYVTNALDYDDATSAQSYGDPFIASPTAPPVLAYTTYPADPRQYGIRLNFKF